MNLFTIRILIAITTIPCFVSAQQKKQHGVVIPVDNVVPATTPYNTYQQEKVLSQAMNKQILIQSNHPNPIVPGSTNSFIETIHLAYAQHHDLLLSPDDIWIQIALGVSIHINQNFGKLHSKVVHSPEKKELFVRMDNLADMKSNDWSQLIDTFALMAQAKIKPEFYNTMLPEFSTSTPETRTVLNVILLSSVKESLSMRGASGCGIPNVVLLGEKKDWEQILVRLDQLAQYDLQFWTDELKPIIREFVNAFDGKANRTFWQQIYKYRQGYMMEEMNGWASKFFPYFVQAEYIDDSLAIQAYLDENPGVQMDEGLVKTTYYPNPYLKGDDYLFHSVDYRDLPSSVCDIPLIWNNMLSNNPEDQEQHLTLHAGFIGIQQSGPKNQLRNNPVWFIVKRDEYSDIDYENWLNSGEHFEDVLPCIWSNEIVSDSVVLAVYHPEKNKNAASGILELKTELTAHMKKQFPAEKLNGTELMFTVSHFGSCSSAEIKGGQLSGKAQAELLLYLKKLNYGFQPAIIPSDKAESILEVIEDLPSSLPANQKIRIIF